MPPTITSYTLCRWLSTPRTITYHTYSRHLPHLQQTPTIPTYSKHLHANSKRLPYLQQTPTMPLTTIFQPYGNIFRCHRQLATMASGGLLWAPVSVARCLDLTTPMSPASNLHTYYSYLKGIRAIFTRRGEDKDYAFF